MENAFCLFFYFRLNSAVDCGGFHVEFVLQTPHGVKFLFPTLMSASTVAAGFWRGLSGRGDSAGMADTRVLD
ncbi:MAG: hypothetical protein WCH98_17090 [Verrucomicrobiota bacterium]